MQPAGTGGRRNNQKVYQDRNLQIIFGVALVSVLGVASLTPAFPKLAEALDVPPESIGLLVTVFTFPTMVLGPVLDVLVDRWGRKKILVPSLLLFGIAGTACAFARDFNLLLLLRFVQGIGAASLLSLSVTLIGDLYVGERRTAAMGYNVSVSSIGTATYPILGGALAVLGWNYPYLWLLFIPTTIFGIGLGIGFPSIQTLLAELAPKEYLGAVMSVNSTFFGLGQTLGPVLMGSTFGLGGINAVFYAGVGVAITTLIVFRYCTCL